MHLTTFDIGSFLRDHWQKRPLLLRDPWAAWQNPIAPDELAGLACEVDVESRLVTRADDRWAVEHGPLDEARFAALGARNWTLLVQAVDQHVPAVADLIAPFRFIPNWRIDDVMASYAADEGGVGPHVDQYDVFLIQGLGRRRWRIGAVPADAPAEPPALLAHDDLRLLAHFDPVSEWVLEPGDILYLPPGVPHDGVAVGADCMTYSIGFRAPSRSELITHWCDHLLAGMAADERYRDADIRVPDNPGEIAPEAIARLHAMVADALLDRDGFARWFGGYSSTPKYPELDWRPERPVTIAALRRRLARDTAMIRNPASRFAFIRQPAGMLLFVDGECFECRAEAEKLAERISAQDEFEIDRVWISSENAMTLLTALFNLGSVAFIDEGD